MNSVTAASEKLSRVDFAYNKQYEAPSPLEEVFWTTFDYPAWQGYESVVHISGPVGGEGELAEIEKGPGEIGWQRKFCKTVKLDPLRQIIWRVYTGPGQVGGPSGWERDFDVTVDFRFEELGPERTLIILQVIKEFFVDTEDEAELARVKHEEYALQSEISEHLAPRHLELLAKKRSAAGS